MASYKHSALYPTILGMLRDGHQPRDIIKHCVNTYNITDRTVTRAISTVRRELAEETREDRQVTFNLLKAGYERDLAEVDALCKFYTPEGEETYINPETGTTQYLIPKAATRIELRRKIRQSLADLYGFGRINTPSITINVAQLLPDQRTAQLWGRRDAIEGVVEAEYTAGGEDARAGNLDVVEGD